MSVDVRGHFHVPVALSRQRFVGTNSVSEWLDSSVGLDMLLENGERFVPVGDRNYGHQAVSNRVFVALVCNFTDIYYYYYYYYYYYHRCMKY